MKTISQQLKVINAKYHLPQSGQKQCAVTSAGHKLEADILRFNYLGILSRHMSTQYTNWSRLAPAVITYLWGITSEVDGPDTE